MNLVVQKTVLDANLAHSAKFSQGAQKNEFQMLRDFVNDIAPAILFSLVLSAAGVIAAVELANVLSH